MIKITLTILLTFIVSFQYCYALNYDGYKILSTHKDKKLRDINRITLNSTFNGIAMFQSFYADKATKQMFACAIKKISRQTNKKYHCCPVNKSIYR